MMISKRARGMQGRFRGEMGREDGPTMKRMFAGTQNWGGDYFGSDVKGLFAK